MREKFVSKLGFEPQIFGFMHWYLNQLDHRDTLKVHKCVRSNANPLHYYALRVPHKEDRWCWVWSIFNSRTAWANHITCGTRIRIVYWRKLRLGWLFVLCNCVVWDDDERKGEGETWCWFIACSSWKAPREPPGLTSPCDGWIAINSTICLLNIHTAEGFGI